MISTTIQSGARRRTLLGVVSLTLLISVITLIVQHAWATTSLTSEQATGQVHEGDEPSVYDEENPVVTQLDTELLAALREAARVAEASGVELRVNSGWRSPAYQERLLEEAVARYGSREEAARWVATPETSAHVAGDAVDIGPYAAAEWLGRHGAAYGLCQIYANEPWHFEFRESAPTAGCPQMYADASHDPRLHA